MSLDVYRANDPDKLLCSLDEQCLTELEKCIDDLARKTGIRIGQYEDTQLYPDHQIIFLSAFDMSNLSNVSSDVKNFVALVLKCHSNNETLIFIGD